MTNSTTTISHKALSTLDLDPQLHSDLAVAILDHLYLEVALEVGDEHLPLDATLNLGAVVLTNGVKQFPLDITYFYAGKPSDGVSILTCYRQKVISQ